MIRFNGQPRESHPESLLDLLSEQGFGLDTKGIAVAINGSVVPRSSWNETRISSGDDIEIVKIMQGG
jgi:sulfur carrier protein